MDPKVSTALKPSVDEKRKSDLDLKADDIAVRREELDWKKQLDKKAWRSPLFLVGIGAILAFLAGITTLLIEKYIERIDANPAAVVAVEQRVFLDLIGMVDVKQRNRILCEHRATGNFATSTTADRLNNFVEKQSLCNASGEVIPPEPQDDCIAKSFAAQTCRAYDKSGFASKPHGACSFNLVPEDGFVFDTQSIEFVEHVTRRIDGKSVENAIEATLIKLGSQYATGYKGKIRCTNDPGTGRTCEYSATVRVGQVPKTCAIP